MTDTDTAADGGEATLDLFVSLSAVLTGFPETRLAPRLDPVNLKQLYLATVQAKAGSATLAALLAAWQGIRDGVPPSGWPAAVEQRILNQGQLGPLARQIIKMWLLGIWYDPPDQTVTGQVISSTAFTHGLLWAAINAHPTGYSELPHGYWSTPPASLTPADAGSDGSGSTGNAGQVRKGSEA